MNKYIVRFNDSGVLKVKALGYRVESNYLVFWRSGGSIVATVAPGWKSVVEESA